VNQSRPPLMVVVGASFTAGTGAAHATDGWAYALARQLGWRAIIRGIPGAGYVEAGAGDAGPIGRQIHQLDIARLRPELIIVQAGHNDAGAPAGVLSSRVTGLLQTLRAEDPGARVALVTVFATGRVPSPAEVATDRTLTDTVRRADPGALVLDPLAQHWRFPTVADHLHPDPSGHLWIAHRVAESLLAAGLQSYGSGCAPHGPLNPSDQSPRAGLLAA
jgi:lysophospholipase L1-like esterase